MKTTLAEEREVLARWRLKPQWESLDLFARLAHNEFRPPEEHAAFRDQALTRLLGFCHQQVPFMQQECARLGLDPNRLKGLEGLHALPVYTKADLRPVFAQRRARALPAGERPMGATKSSGTTGEPFLVEHTLRSQQMFTYLKHREYRWFRVDPMGTLGWIRVKAFMPEDKDGRKIDVGTTLHWSGWRYMETFFQTGPMTGFAQENPVDRRLDWVEREGVTVLNSTAAFLLMLSFGENAAEKTAGLRDIQCIAETIRPALRRRVETCLGAPVHENYGLNEAGLVAIRCSAGHYHWHTEHVHVDICDYDGQPASAGERGRLVVTVLTNFRMPLLRYDTGDLAVAAGEGEACPCGRGSPYFAGPIVRSKMVEPLPADVYGLIERFLDRVDRLPNRVLETIRCYQLHHEASGAFHLKIVPSTANLVVPPTFDRAVQVLWREAAGADKGPLPLRPVAELPLLPNGKFFPYLSDLIQISKPAAAAPAS